MAVLELVTSLFLLAKNTIQNVDRRDLNLGVYITPTTSAVFS